MSSQSIPPRTAPLEVRLEFLVEQYKSTFSDPNKVKDSVLGISIVRELGTRVIADLIALVESQTAVQMQQLISPRYYMLLRSIIATLSSKTDTNISVSILRFIEEEIGAFVDG